MILPIEDRMAEGILREWENYVKVTFLNFGYFKRSNLY